MHERDLLMIIQPAESAAAVHHALRRIDALTTAAEEQAGAAPDDLGAAASAAGAAASAAGAAASAAGADAARAFAHAQTCLAALAGGRFDRVRAIITTLARQPAAPQLPLVVARHVAWTGDLTTAAVAWGAVRTALDLVLADEHHARLRFPTCTELQRTATDIGDPSLAASLHRAARAAAAAGAGGTPDAWTDADVVLDFVHRLVGAEPDAARHRLRLRPDMTAAGAIEVRGIRFGDGRVSLHCRWDRTGRRLRCRVEQDAGAIPATVLLEPIVPGTVSGAQVDGQPAGLAPQPHHGATLVPVQLVLDDVRRLDIDVSGDAQRPPT